MGKSQRSKGKRGERQLATELREAFPHLADRICRGWQARDGADAPDVVVPGLDYWFEHKSGKQPNPRAALKQAIEESAKGTPGQFEMGPDGIPFRNGSPHTPIAVIRDDRKEPFAVMLWRDLLDLLVRLHNRDPYHDDGKDDE